MEILSFLADNVGKKFYYHRIQRTARPEGQNKPKAFLKGEKENDEERSEKLPCV